MDIQGSWRFGYTVPFCLISKNLTVFPGFASMVQTIWISLLCLRTIQFLWKYYLCSSCSHWASFWTSSGLFIAKTHSEFHSWLRYYGLWSVNSLLVVLQGDILFPLAIPFKISGEVLHFKTKTAGMPPVLLKFLSEACGPAFTLR